MPSLIRFVVAIGLLSGLVLGSLYVLSEHFEPQTQEVAKTVDGVKIRKQ